MKKRSRIKSEADIRASKLGDVFKLKKIYVERERESLSKPLKAPPPSYKKRVVESRQKFIAKRSVPLALKKDLKKFSRAEIVAGKRGGYYTARAASALIKLGATGKEQPERITVKKSVSYHPLPRGWYAIEIDGKIQKKHVRWKEISRATQKAGEDKKLELIAARIGATPRQLRKYISTLRAQEGRKVKRFKGSKKFKGYSVRKRKTVTVKRRIKAIIGAMGDLLQVYGSPRALRAGGEAVWKKINGKNAIKSGRKWLEKIGPDEWREIKPKRGK